MLLDQSPLTSEIECLCMDIDGHRIVNVCKSPPTQLQSLNLPVFPQPYLYAGNLNCYHIDWGYDNDSPDVQLLIVLPSCIKPRVLPAFTPAAGTL